ncbi:hypothetical protein LEP1GSC073_2143 [Leptospira noguchii str. Cascata]|nr:hypothetical protein LEP1GSC073_2143 [Leptospira noguchii str. Cascata]
MGTTSNHDFTDKSLKCGNYYFKKILSHFLHKTHNKNDLEKPTLIYISQVDKKL